MTLRLAHITFDCHNPISLSAFWSAALGRPVDPEPSEYFATIGFPSRPESNTWMFIRVPEAKTTKNRMHVDLSSNDRPGDVARLISLGAEHVGDYDEFGHQWTTLRDPEGNEFCVS
ncbi:MAG TPA: glyoxalase/bleomycin resistance/dioxygenase family protein [Acidimicrobiaceae bacterium]|jgi:hypothetical protein|nr:glyoxalase/bleomycin resistance/dioxygenase family protein [Acidimicrobiaceae bacterium]